jgi:hypothetical protein
MPRFCTIIGVLLIAALLIAPMFDSTAAIKVRKTARSWNEMAPPSTAPWNMQNGLRAVGVGSRSYFKADTTGSGAVGTPAWTITAKPGGSALSALDSADGKWINSIRPDVVGQYIVSATVGGQTAADTIYASTYSGVGTDATAGCFCHAVAMPSTPSTASAIKTSWSTSVHATMFKRGITGYQEGGVGFGQYNAGCIKCHVTGWDTTAAAAANGNFGRVAKASGWDTTWYKGYQKFGSDYLIPNGDSTKWITQSATQMALGTIGCEQCHGPAADHKAGGDKMKIGRTLEPGVCNQCHDGSSRHNIGTFFKLSGHAIGDLSGSSEGGRATCQPCHTSRGFIYYMDHNKDTSGIAAVWNSATDPGPINCVVCHDPHGSNNEKLLRTTTMKGDTLRNGYKIPAAYRTGDGMLCANCHYSRYSVNVRVTNKAPLYGYTSRFGPHGNPQADMLFGGNGYTFGDTTINGLGTHMGLEGTCITCHMQPRPNSLSKGATALANHTFHFDTTYAGSYYKPTDACSRCHGDIEDFNDIRASYDYDRNGKIEGVQTEVQGMLDKLKLVLPKDTSGNVIGTSGATHADSVAIAAGGQALIGKLWNYYLVLNDKSMGVHNTKYAVALLYKSLGWTPLSVKDLPGVLPKQFALDQNYPNPFNPSTTIRFALPTESLVKLTVYDMTGAVVKNLMNNALGAGNKEVTWDGTNASGAKVATGMYIYRLEAGNFSAVKKMLLLK